MHVLPAVYLEITNTKHLLTGAGKLLVFCVYFSQVWCGDSWPYDERIDAATNGTIIVFGARTIYYTTVSFVLYFIPMIVVSLAYTAIVCKLWSSRPPGEVVQATVNGQSTRLRNNKKVSMILEISSDTLLIYFIARYRWLCLKIDWSILIPSLVWDRYNRMQIPTEIQWAYESGL